MLKVKAQTRQMEEQVERQVERQMERHVETEMEELAQAVECDGSLQEVKQDMGDLQRQHITRRLYCLWLAMVTI